jgi:enoyl-CoA hydratase/carnithine racemase
MIGVNDLLKLAIEGQGVLPRWGEGLPGGGAVEWLPRLVGRPRALEIILNAHDYDADTAESYGMINRIGPTGDPPELMHLHTLASQPATRAPYRR